MLSNLFSKKWSINSKVKKYPLFKVISEPRKVISHQSTIYLHHYYLQNMLSTVVIFQVFISGNY